VKVSRLGKRTPYFTNLRGEEKAIMQVTEPILTFAKKNRAYFKIMVSFNANSSSWMNYLVTL
jgi:hypothetical protein